MLNRIKYFYSIFSDAVLNLIYNKKCLICGCGKDNILLCKNCLKDVENLSGFAHRISDGVLIYSATNYNKNIKKLIHKLKFQHRKNTAIVLAEILFKYFQKTDLYNNSYLKDFIIIYPDTFYLKKLYRGYNHAYLIAKQFSKLSGLKIEKDVILKTKFTKPQFKSRNKRKNILNSFKINPKKINNIKDKSILLIDDITTSGATLDEIIKCLKALQIQNITCLTVAKAG